jgi:hypothetical protein
VSDPNEIVGHKTIRNEGGDWPFFRHEPLRRAEAEALMEQCRKDDVRRRSLMPDEEAAISMFFQAWQRLKELGWQEAYYCPKDGSEFLVIEAGSTGQHPCVYEGEWPDGQWHIKDSGYSHPVLFKPMPEPTP